MASGERQGLQIAVIVLATLTVFAAVFAFVFYKQYSDQEQALADAEARARVGEAAAREFQQALEVTAELVGHPLDVSAIGGRNSRPGDGTFVGALRADLRDYAGRMGDQTADDLSYHKALERYHNTLVALQNETGYGQYALDFNTDELVARRQETQEEIDARQDLVEDTQQSLQDATDQFAESRNQWEVDRDALQVSLRDMQRENEQLRNDAIAQQRLYQQQITQQISLNDVLRQELDDLRRPTFEVPDGYVRWVDYDQNRVWINLGRADELPERLTMNVYELDANGVARTAPKASIEVTRIIGPHLAEARILTEELTMPIRSGDPVFTPLWTPGRQRHFALGGVFDVDGDGEDDRELIYRLIGMANGLVDQDVYLVEEINEETGQPQARIELSGEGVTIQTNYLVMGTQPEPGPNATREEIAVFADFSGRLTDLLSTANDYGVEVINIDEFLNLIGYTPRQRLWEPGSGEYPLRAGRESGASRASTGYTSGDTAIRSSTGSTSGASGRSVETNTGRTSELFRSY